MLNSPQLEQDRNLVLIGYRATGKSSVGARLARILNRPFVDLDQVLVQEAGKSIADVVATGGWEEFRRLEKALVVRLGAEQGLVLATGGGVILDPENVRILKNNGILVWLKADSQTIRARLSQDQAQVSNRPSLSEVDYLTEVESVLRQREALYQNAADIEVETNGLTIPQVAELIITAARRLGGINSGG